MIYIQYGKKNIYEYCNLLVQTETDENAVCCIEIVGCRGLCCR